MTKNILLKLSAIVAICLLNSCSQYNPDDKFSYSLIPVQSYYNGIEKWGYIDMEGNYIMNPQFKSAFLFTDGIALVRSHDYKMGYIGEDGLYVINPIYLSATNFSEGLAFVVVKNGFPTCIDTKGQTKFVLKNVSKVGTFKNGLAFIEVKDKYGCIDKSGNIVINPQFDLHGQFSEGLAAIAYMKDKDADPVWGYIDQSGKIVINPQFKSASDFKEGKALVGDGKKFGFINKKGLYTINPEFDRADDFNEGLAGIKQGETWGFINTEGKIVINPQFNYVRPFKNGLAAVMSDGEKWGYIDKEGKFAINPQFQKAGQFVGEYAIVSSNDKMGLIDKKGKYVVNPQFSDVHQYLFYGRSGTKWAIGESVYSDYFDISEITSKFFTNSKDGSFRGLNRQTSLLDLAENPDYKEALNENSKYSVINSVKKIITDDVEIEQSIFYTQTPIYDYVQNNYYGYQLDPEKQYNLSAKLASAEFKIKLTISGRASSKGKILAEGIKTELIHLYQGTEKNNEFLDAKSQYFDTLAIISENNTNNNKSGIFFVSTAKINFSINYTISSVTVIARFKDESKI